MDNYEKVVGTKDCPLKKVVSILQKSTLIQDQWSTFARELDVSSEQIKKFRKDLLLDKFIFGDLIFEVLEIWIGNNGSKATLPILLQVIEGHCGANDVGELLRLEYKLPCKEADINHSIEWKELSPAFQKRVIENFQHLTPNSKFTETLPKLSGAALVSLMRGKKPHILSLPEKLSYYVSRTIVTRNIISDKIFDQNSSDIFLFTGVDQYELSVLAKDKLTSSSTQQLHTTSKVKFLILDQANHFKKICEKTNYPVHLIRREREGKLRWIKSKGAMDNLREYIDEKQDELDEGQFCQICNSQSVPVLLCDTPGMGKSVLLAQVGNKLVQLYPDRTVLFIVLSEFIKLSKTFGVKDRFKMIELTLQDWTGEELPQSKLNSDENTVLIELLLDGYDEVGSTDRKLALEIFQTIIKSFKCIRLWITSRPHLMEELENNLSILGYNIRPFHGANQIHFLSSFWSRKVKLNQEKVELFAKQCLKSLNATMNSTDNDIAGIPLQCLLIGEVYEEDAVEYAKLDKEHGASGSAAVEIEIGTITNLYRQLVKIKFQKYKSSFENAKLSEYELMTIHSHLSLELLFPTSHETLRLTKASEIDMDEVMKGGILTSARMGAVTFIHRTFAEYFVAWFIFDKLQQEEEWTPEVFDLFLKILECLRHQNKTKFAHPVICYFLNSMIANLQNELLPNHFPSEFHNWELALIEMIVLSCIGGNFVQIFKLFDQRQVFHNLSGNLFSAGLLLRAIRHSSVELVTSILTHFERHHLFDLEVQKSTLREAVKQGKFSILEFLIKEKRLRGLVEILARENTNLACDCVAETKRASDGELKEKILVLQMLLGIKESLVDGLDGHPATAPLLTEQAHLKLLKELVRLGANVDVQNRYGDTILHLSNLNYYKREATPLDCADTRKDYHKLVKAIPKDCFKKLVHVKGALPNRDTALMTILRRFDPWPKTLIRFHDVGADFNHVNEGGESPLTVAIGNDRNAKTIHNLVHLGAQAQVTNSKFRATSLLHAAAELGNGDAVGVLLDECKINVNALDEKERTPLDIAIKNFIVLGTPANGKDKRLKICLALFERGGRFKEVVTPMGGSWLHEAVTDNLESVKLLVRLGINVNGIDKEGNTPLHVALSPRYKIRNYPIIQHLLQMGANPLALNNLNVTPFESFLRNYWNENKEADLKIFRLFKSIWDERSLWTPTIATLALGYTVSRGDTFLDSDFEDLAQGYEAHGADFNSSHSSGNSLLHFAAIDGKATTVKLLCSKGINVNSTNNPGHSPLQEAALSKHSTSLEIIKCLIENGANPMEKTLFGDNILHFAAIGRADVLKYFLELGGLDINEKDSHGNTLLHCAMDRRKDEDDCLEKCRALIQHGADVNILNREGKSPLDIAKRYKDKLLIQLIRSASVSKNLLVK